MTKVKYTGLISGIVLIIIGFLVYYLRPLSNCAWWNIFCQGGSLLITPIFLILSIILTILGVIILIISSIKSLRR